MQCFMTEGGVIYTINPGTGSSTYKGDYRIEGEVVLLLEPKVRGYAKQLVIQECKLWGSLAELAAALESKDEGVGELVEALDATLTWIDAVPSETALPTMPGFDRDWVESVKSKFEIKKPFEQQAQAHGQSMN